MTLLNIARNKVFWLLDNLKGGQIHKSYSEIKKIDEMDSDNPYVIEHQRRAWEILKKKACFSTRAYALYVDKDFKDFPIITKQDIRENQEDYLSNEYDREDLIKMYTSGSTGTPFVCYQNRDKKRIVSAEVIYYSEKVGYKLGDNLSYIRTVVKQNKKSVIKQFMQNQTMINCGHLGDEDIESLIAQLKLQSVKGKVTLLAYGSTYTAMKDYLKRHNISKIYDLNVVGAVSGSDMLYDETRSVVSNALGGIPLASRYSNEENGVIGQDEGINNVFIINEADYIIEILGEDFKPVKEGAIGRIIVTDLYNYAMPMIRYDTGDMGSIKTIEINGRKKKCITSFSGRRVDTIFDAYNVPISPHSITNIMWEYTDIIQFQLVQTDEAKYLIKINAKESFNREDDLLSSLKSVLGVKSDIVVERVNEIPVLASGKRRYIVNDWK